MHHPMAVVTSREAVISDTRAVSDQALGRTLRPRTPAVPDSCLDIVQIIQQYLGIVKLTLSRWELS